MTSFPVEIEPPPEPRLAAAALLLHLSAAALPWATRCPTWLAVSLSLLANGCAQRDATRSGRDDATPLARISHRPADFSDRTAE